MTNTLAYKDRFKRVAESVITSDTSNSVVFASLPDDVSTPLKVEWTGRQFTKLLSSVMTGADLMFPDEADEIIWQLIKAVHLEQIVDPVGDCFEYRPSSPIFTFSPDNPYISGDRAAGWNKEAWFRWGSFDTIFPDWIDNWLGGLVGELTNYEPNDILFNIESIPINPIDAWLSGGGLFPKIEIRFSGTGSVNVELLSFPLGGKAVIELDEEPNALDIVTGGLLDPNAIMVELNRDLLNFPPSEYPNSRIRIEVTETGDHVLYIVFVPILDDALLPVAFGGGIRSVELCGFTEVIEPAMENIFWDGCQLVKISGGIETVVVTAAEIQACLDIPEGGGGGGGLATKTYRLGNVGFGTITTTSTTFVDMATLTLNHTPTRANMLVMVENVILFNSAGNQPIYVRILANGAVGLDASEEAISSGAAYQLAVSDRWAVTPDISIPIKLQWRTPSGTATRQERSSIHMTIIEFDDASDLFVEDVRIEAGELQKKIGGVWINVTESLDARLDSITATASAALAAAAAAQATANTAATVNAAQTSLINALDVRMDEAELNIGGLNGSIVLHDSRLDALEAAIGDTSQEAWAQEWNFLTDDHDFTLTVGSWVSGQGFVFSDTTRLQLPTTTIFDGRITHMKMNIRKMTGGFGTITIEWQNSSGYSVVRTSGGTLLNNVWSQVPNRETQPTLVDFLLSNFAGEHRLEGLKLLGRGVEFFP